MFIVVCLLVFAASGVAKFSTGYKRVFEELTLRLKDKFPNLPIEGDNFPPHPIRQHLAAFLSLAKFALIIAVLVIDSITEKLGVNIEHYPILGWCRENKLTACLMIFFITNTIENQLMATGAFEVSLNNERVWSKLETGRLPSLHELFDMVEERAKITTLDMKGFSAA
ncbi:thioredoxin reductase-like selenoprotein T1b [Oscarella lobularis]|uniref:thioredoxin reductase-like selenoprotein T1b n=1 Tax=Oscarella lobularis TaxID=121494 RepID=UPI003313448A